MMKTAFKALAATFILCASLVNLNAAPKDTLEFDGPYLVLRTDIAAYFYITQNDGKYNLIFPACYNKSYIPEYTTLDILKIDLQTETYKTVNDIFENLNTISVADKPSLTGQDLPPFYIRYEPGKNFKEKEAVFLDTKAPEVRRLYELLQPQVEQQELLTKDFSVPKDKSQIKNFRFCVSNRF